MPETNPESLIQIIGTISLAVTVVFISIRKFLKDFNKDSAENSIITLMHAELERMAQQNTALSVELGRLHTEVINLNHQLQKLTVENQSLHSEITLLTKELTRLQLLIQKGNFNDLTN
jgi:peptidoglycan hydrolase CwlO-like protein